MPHQRRWCVFQSSLAPKGERYQWTVRARHQRGSFNPRSPRRASATPAAPGCADGPSSFNPRSPRRASATLREDGQPCVLRCCDPRSPRRASATRPASPADARMFRSSLAPKGERYARPIRPVWAKCRFNPRPPQRTGAATGKRLR